MKKIFLFLPFYFLLFTCLSFAQTLAPGAPGKDAHWATAGKQAIGTSASLESKVWFTLAQGALTEVYYPDVTTANVHLLQFIVVNKKTKTVESERDGATHKLITEQEYYGGTPLTQAQINQLRQEGLNIPNIKKVKPEEKLISENTLEFIQQNTAKSGKWKIKKRYVTDIQNNSVLVRVFFESTDKNLELYVYYDPSLGNTGMHDTAWNEGEVLLAQDKNKCSAVIIGEGRNSEKFADITSGFYQTSDGIEPLERDGKLSTTYQKAENGNVVQMAKIVSTDKKFANFTLSLGFGETPQTAFDSANNSLKKGFDNSYIQFVGGWNDYVKTLPAVEPKYQAQFNMAAMVLKASEDKTVRGANVASLTIPWGGGANANEDVGGGYHLVWSRDLYQVVTAYMALNDLAAANRALDFLFNVQQKADGSFPQNSQLDGKGGWGSLQLDEVAYPLIIAYQLKRFDRATYENHVRRAADFLVKTGPKTVQERWEERSGYSPSTIAAEIAGLVCAAEIARKNGDEASATIYLATADDWARNIERWTATTNGKFGDGNYYLRLTENGKPDANEKTVLSNEAGTFLENEIVDAGFLELVRLGIKSPDDPLIQKSVEVVDKILKVDTPNGAGFYRYNHDGYGEMDDGRRWNWDGKYTGKGRLWALLSGERGQYELAMSSRVKEKQNEELKTRVDITEQDDRPIYRSMQFFKAASERLDAMAKFANDGLMISEQVWDKADVPKNIDKQYVPELKFGEGTGSATPLAWSMAQFIRLAVNLQAGRNLDTPDVVYNRYVLGKKDSGEIKNQLFVNLPETPCNREYDLIKMTFQADSPADSKGRVSKFKINHSPVIWRNKAIFYFENKGGKVDLAGDFSNWKPMVQDFKKIPNTNLQCFQMKFAPTARVEYKFIVDGKWITDPMNPNKIDNGVGGENSFFTMPDYKPTIWSNILNEGKNNVPNYIPRYVDSVEIDSKQYGKVNVGVYAPNVAPKHSLPVLYAQDGGVYQSKARAVEIQNNLVKAGKIKPFIIVFLDPKDRMKEYWANDDYARFLATEVVPAIDAKYDTIKNRDGRAILGASLGGVTSVHTALKYPEIFGRVGGQSSSFWIDDKRVIKELENLDAGKNKFKFYLDTGTLEGADDDRKAVEILRRKGFNVSYQEAESGHNWTAWRDRLADAFIALWRN